MPFSANASIHATSSRSKGNKTPVVAQHPGRTPARAEAAIPARPRGRSPRSGSRGTASGVQVRHWPRNCFAPRSAARSTPCSTSSSTKISIRAAYGELAPCHRLHHVIPHARLLNARRHGLCPSAAADAHYDGGIHPFEAGGNAHAGSFSRIEVCSVAPVRAHYAVSCGDRRRGFAVGAIRRAPRSNTGSSCEGRGQGFRTISPSPTPHLLLIEQADVQVGDALVTVDLLDAVDRDRVAALRR